MTTVDKIEIEKFSKLAKQSWDPHGKFKPLHLFNPARIKFIKEKLISNFKLDSNSEKPLNKLKIIDIGCGAGLLCEPLNRLGAKITGIDASKENIEVARIHSKEMNLNIDYIHRSPEKLNFKNEFDVLLSMEVIEHTKNVNLFIQSCSKLIKRNGIMFIATINKNLKSYIFAIISKSCGVKNLSQSWVPIGNHLKIYSAPNTPNIYDFKFLLIVATNMIPFFLINLEQFCINRFTFETCSTTSIFNITSNSFSKFRFSGEQ